MHRACHRALVLIVALALVASATAWRQCAALQMAAGIGGGSNIASGHAQASGHGEHGALAMHAEHATHNSHGPATPATDDHGSMKCCSMCTVASALLPAASATVIFAVSFQVFSGDPEAWIANTVAVDPGIPKHTV